MRWVWVIGGYLAASFTAATASMLFASVLSDPTPFHSFSFRAVIFSWTFVALLSVAPAAAVIGYGESQGIRTSWYYALGGAAAAFIWFVPFLIALPLGMIFSAARGHYPSILGPMRYMAGGAVLSSAAGMADGLVYWVIAGRSAGPWREVQT
jgi:hypothetical protein